jgi:hypothetical protein
VFSKAKIFNLALGALLLQRQITNADTDTSNEANVLRTHWDVALQGTLEDLDLDSTSEPITLELVAEEPNDKWLFAYKYPPRCAFFRRIESAVLKDNHSTHIAKRVGLYEGQKVIFTNESEAVAECVVNDMSLTLISANLAMSIAYKLARLSAPLITGKGADRLIKNLDERYVYYKAEAQKKDQLENFVYEDPEVESEFVEARLE